MPTWTELTTFMTTLLATFSDGIILGMIAIAAIGGVGYLMRQGKK